MQHRPLYGDCMKWYLPWENPMSEYENELDEYDKKFKRKVEKSLFDPSYDKSVDDFNAEYGTRVRMLIGGVPSSEILNVPMITIAITMIIFVIVVCRGLT